ncbi:MAG: hypothetical protein QF673_02610 [Candidatus Hydrothermarchaeota archaeon]|nr:hypothetical protein [Candidatus Hydrothermarchaeota archaeon]
MAEEIDFDRCMKCRIPLNYCDGLTRYKCGRETKDVKRYCLMDK